ncbi:hypothetical protein HPY42_00425 [Coprothermobacteraceae bacterium]|nr:hypothetical protein [Coprothermobacteraceae bacterium]
MTKVSAVLEDGILLLTIDENNMFEVAPIDGVSEEPWGFVLSAEAAKDPSVYRYARYAGKNIVVCFGPWDNNGFTLFKRTWVGVQENQLVSIEVFQEEDNAFFVGIVPVELTPNRTGLIEPNGELLTIEMTPVFELRTSYPLHRLMNPELYMKYERYLLGGGDDV